MKTYWHTILLAWIISFWGGFVYGEELPEGTIQLPSSLVCGDYKQNLEQLQDKYDERPFINGTGTVLTPDWNRAYPGSMRMFFNPDKGTYTIFLDIEKRITCLVITGSELEVTVSGESL